MRRRFRRLKLLFKLLFPVLALLSGCGYRSRDNELVGQVKRIIQHTPLLCPDYTEVDLSMGVMRNGVGSMSSEDKYLVVVATDQRAALAKAAVDGTPVKVTYDDQRFTFCVPPERITKVEPAP